MWFNPQTCENITNQCVDIFDGIHIRHIHQYGHIGISENGGLTPKYRYVNWENDDQGILGYMCSIIILPIVLISTIPFIHHMYGISIIIPSSFDQSSYPSLFPKSMRIIDEWAMDGAVLPPNFSGAKPSCDKKSGHLRTILLMVK